MLCRFLLLLTSSSFCSPPSNTLNPYPDKPRLTFDSNGSFKITIFSDLHFGEDEFSFGIEQDVNSTRLMRTVLLDEKPDYVVLNGDLITGENTYRTNSTDYINVVVAPLVEHNVPFSSTHGNHDNQANITHLEEIERERSIAPLSYTRAAPPGIGGVGGEGNYWVPVYPTVNALKPNLIMWFFDSRGGFSPGPDSKALPDWVDASVANWIKSETAMMESAWGPSIKRGALAFVHIPPHKIEQVQRNLDPAQNKGLNEDYLGSGSTQDSGDSGKDSPFYDALSKHVKNLHALISGHDHGNEWCAREPSKGIVFCFDKHSGYGGYSDEWWGHGVRNIRFTDVDASKPPETWIRYENGTVNARVCLGSNFGR